MKNLKYRTVGLAANVMQAMGLKVTALPGGEIMPAMEKGVIEAFEYNNPTSDRRFGAADVAKFYMLSSYHQPSECLEIEFNKTKCESLAKEQQAILTPCRSTAANSTNLWHGLSATTPKDLQALIQKDGVKVHRTSEVDPRGAARRLGQGGRAVRQGGVVQEDVRQPEGLGEGRRLLPDC